MSTHTEDEEYTVSLMRKDMQLVIAALHAYAQYSLFRSGQIHASETSVRVNRERATHSTTLADTLKNKLGHEEV